ncbi:DegT/DnrJ/EryC1/StrS family aminotransferase [Robertmurraya kyonggiensis]|uniref:DegT/DnrJ/EryC1/StrS family aminotransferase n=1 Tax=Robertmurraya kyonggiensis TaxID=1037680 RepID=A0A4U1D170_9BACI|nr:DegT/DnrJ/EryC1/StrS family aminotransferase [Robertmurraya kyonggiensis]TKC15498.1 DegT/DnrJ/EryC1/StrS family aminotransferase [Robertmurraya kyonggiensis]
MHETSVVSRAIPALKQPIHVTSPLLPDIQNLHVRLREVWEKKWVTNNGEQHRQLEEALKNYLEIDEISLFNNGTLALVLGIKTLELTGEVITTPFTFPATVQALDWNGLTPIFCDIEKDSWNIDAYKIESLITDKTSAILAVHVFGNPCNVVKIQEIAEKYHLKVIYDGAHAFGTKINNKPISRYGDMTMLSFHATKLFNTIEGGALIFNDPALIEKVNSLKNFGLVSPEEVKFSGLNAKMNEIQASVGLEVLKIIDEERTKRDHIRRTYENELDEVPGIRIVTMHHKESSSYQYFVIEINENEFGRSRDWVHEEFKNYNVFTRRYFTPLCSDFAWYSHLSSAHKKNLPQAYKTVSETLSMPFYGGLEKEDVIRICEILKSFYSKVVQ